MYSSNKMLMLAGYFVAIAAAMPFSAFVASFIRSIL
jgi:hypothetical protein